MNTEKKIKHNILFAYINIVLIFIILITISIAMIILTRPEISEIERRSLAKMPKFSVDSYLSGEFFSDLSAYYNDTVPFRDDFKRLSSRIRGSFGLTLTEVEFYGDIFEITKPTETIATDTLITEPEITKTIPSTEPNETSSDVSLTEPEITESTTTVPADVTEKDDEPDILVEINNNIFMALTNGSWRAMPNFGGGSGKDYAASLNHYKKDLGVNVFSMIIPTSDEFYLPSAYSKYNASHRESIDSVNSMLNGVIPVDAYTALENHVNEDIFSRTDHHWQPLGAYYAAKEFATTAKVDFSELSNYTKVEIPDYLGTFYSMTQDAKLLNNPEIFTYYKPENNYSTYYYTTDYTFEYEFPFFVGQPTSQSYSTFMGGDSKIVRIETGVKNGRRLAIWKDSFGNAMVPFLFNSFEEIFVLDVRYFDLNAIDFMKENNISDVLFAMCTFTAVDVSKAVNLENNRLRNCLIIS